MKTEEVDLPNGQHISYVNHGHGKQVVLWMPGSLGTWYTDFSSIFDSIPIDQLTCVSWDPPGYGKSRPPNRDYSPFSNQADARCAAELMQHLGFTHYSVAGWSDGGVTALHLAHQQPDKIDRILVWGTAPYMTQTMRNMAEIVGKNIYAWAPDNRHRLSSVAGEAALADAAKAHFASRKRIYDEFRGERCSKILPDIKQPVLVLHGDNDPLVSDEQLRYLIANLPDCRFHDCSVLLSD